MAKLPRIIIRGKNTGDAIGYWDTDRNTVVDIQGRVCYGVTTAEEAMVVMIDWCWEITPLP